MRGKQHFNKSYQDYCRRVLTNIHFFQVRAMRRILVVLISFSISCQSSQDSKITIAVAANLQYAMPELITAFEKQTNIKVETSSSSSGILTTQIKQGAPFDLFLSADMNHPQILFEEGFSSQEPEVYAEGKLILWTLKKELKLDSGIFSLLNSEIHKIAIANAKTAPYGFAATEALTSSGLLVSLSSKLIIGESISQVNQYIQSMNVDIGITSKSVLFSPFITDQGFWVEIPDTLYPPIAQGIVLLKHGEQENLSNSKEFYKFMLSKEAKEILSQYGYSTSK